MVNRVGQQLGNYHLNRLLGHGGFADVYLGEHIYLKTQAAIKVLRTRLASDESDDFLNEARTVARLEHPHIVRVLEFGVEDQSPFLVVSYAPNGTLRHRHPKGTRLPLEIILPYVRQVASALQYAHEQKVIHRDIKPENMLLGRNNDILLSDFGIALIAQSTKVEDLSRGMAGTVAYMAPEQLQGKPRYASDQYSLGIVVYEWLSGERPFQGTFAEMASQHMLALPPPLHHTIRGISPEVEQVVMMALAKDPQQRFRSIEAFANALGQAGRSDVSVLSRPTLLATPPPPKGGSQVVTPAVGQMGIVTPHFSAVESVHTPPVAPDPVSTPEQVPSQSQVQFKSRFSRRALVVGLGVGVVGLAGAGGGIFWLGPLLKQPMTPKPPAPLGTLLITYRGHILPVYAVGWSPNGQRLVSASNDGTVQVWDATTGKRFFTYRGHSASVNAVAWSPDGTRIASTGSDLTVQVWSATQTNDTAFGEKPLITYRGHSGNMRTLAWSPDGSLIVSGGDDKTIQVWEAGTGKRLLTYSGHSNRVWSVGWSPDGTRIVSGSVDKTAKVWNVASRLTLVTYKGHTDEVKAVSWSSDGIRIVSASNDKTVQVWEAASGKHLLTYAGHSDVLNAVAWAPNDKRIASGSGDYTVQIWDASSATHLFTYHGHALAVHSVAWSPNKQFIASASDDWSVQVWQAV